MERRPEGWRGGGQREKALQPRLGLTEDHCCAEAGVEEAGGHVGGPAASQHEVMGAWTSIKVAKKERGLN